MLGITRSKACFLQLLYSIGGSKVLNFDWLMHHKWNVIEQFFRSYCTQLDAVFFLMAIMQNFKHVLYIFHRIEQCM